jgi:DNA-binding PadR family transcriptional regulator
MLSKNALFVLGIIAGGPVNPYAIVKLVNLKRTDARAKIPTPSIYGIVNILKKNKYITGKKTDGGNMPQMTVYSITLKGKDFLDKTLTSYLASPEETLSELALSTIMLGHLNRERVLAALAEYKVKIESEISIRKRMIAKDKEYGISYAGIISDNHILDMLKVNLKTVNTLSEKMRNDSEWNLGPAPFWRDQVPGNHKK